MAGTVGNNQAATLNQLQGMLGNLQGMANANGVALGGGGTTPATGAAATPAAGAAGAAGATGAAGTAAAAGPVGTFTTNNGRQVTVNRDANGQMTLAAPTGTVEVVNIDGKSVRFSATGKQTTAFELTESLQFKINLDNRDGIATGLANLSRIFGARQERVRMLSNALADDANDTGSFNPVDLQKMSLETTTTQQLSEMQKKIFDSMRDSIQAWLR